MSVSSSFAATEPLHFKILRYGCVFCRTVVAPLHFTLSFGSPLTVLLQTQEYLHVFISRNWISCLILRWTFRKYSHKNIKKNCTYLSVHPSVPLAMTGVDLVPTEVTQLEPKTVLPCKFFNSMFFTNKNCFRIPKFVSGKMQQILGKFYVRIYCTIEKFFAIRK